MSTGSDASALRIFVAIPPRPNTNLTMVDELDDEFLEGASWDRWLTNYLTVLCSFLRGPFLLEITVT